MNYTVLPLYILYACCSIALLLYGLNTYVMVALRLFRYKKSDIQPPSWDEDDPESWPFVTVQLPIYNEQNVIERCIEAAVGLDWPRDRLEIQVLDDSTDITSELIDDIVESHLKRGVPISVIRREDRTGYKAGALANGMKVARGEYFAIFDADFVPPPDVLKRLMPEFDAEPRVGFVQARWGHLNRDENIFTRCQALGIDGHFLVEQSARFAAGLFMNFNGTAGIWSRRAIEDAGGWQGTTLTEDLDLSYRAMLKGYKPRYRPDVVIPAEIPATICGMKSQQFRWAKGSMQTLLLMAPRVFKGNYSLFKKLQAVFHLSNYAVHPLLLSLALMALPIITLFQLQLPDRFWFWALIPLIAATIGPSTMYTVATLLDPDGKPRRLLWLPLLIVIGTGIAISNSLAVFEALVGRQSGFVRTPKRGERHISGYRLKRSYSWLFEIALGVYSVGSITAGFMNHHYGILPFLIIFASGFLLVGLRTASSLGSDA